MSIGILFWVLMILWAVFGIMWRWPGQNRIGPYGVIGDGVFLFVLFLLLGWGVFGPILHR